MSRTNLLSVIESKKPNNRNATRFTESRLIPTNTPLLIDPDTSIEMLFTQIPNVSAVLGIPSHLLPGGTTYPRLSAPVPMSESAIRDVIIDGPAQFRELTSESLKIDVNGDVIQNSTTNNGSSSSCSSSSSSRSSSTRKKRVPVQTKIQPHQLYCITQQLHINGAIPRAIWMNNAVNANMNEWGKLFQGYKHKQSRGTYVKQILKDEIDQQWGIPLFGVKNNALAPIVRLAAITGDKMRVDIIMHSVSMICLQYYCVEHERFIEVDTNSTQCLFNESIQPELFLIFARWDIKTNNGERETFKPSLDRSNFEQQAYELDYISLVYAVLKHIQPLCNQNMGIASGVQITDRHIENWCNHKVFNNFLLFLITSRFSLAHIYNYDELVLDSLSAGTSHKRAFQSGGDNPWMEIVRQKFFPAPKFLDLEYHKFSGRVSSTAASASSGADLSTMQYRIPSVYCHFHLSSQQSLMAFDESLSLEWPVETDHVELLSFTADQLMESCKQQDKVVIEIAKCCDASLVDQLHVCLNNLYKSFIIRRSKLVLYQCQSNINSTTALKRVKCANDRQVKAALSTATTSNRKRKNDVCAGMVISNENIDALEDSSIPAVVATGVVSLKKRKKKSTAEIQSVLNDEVLSTIQLRPVYKPLIKVNLVRSRYSYILHGSWLHTNVNRFMDWCDSDRIDSETSVNFITLGVWNWLIASARLAVAQTKYAERLQVRLKDQDAPAGSFVKLTEVSSALYTVWLDSAMQVGPYSFEKEVLVELAKELVNWKQTPSITNPNLNLYTIYYAFIVITGKENEAVVLWKEFAITYLTTSKQNTKAELTAEYLLQYLQNQYNEWRSQVLDIDFDLLSQSSTLSVLISKSEQEWNGKSVLTPTADKWKLSFHSAVLRSHMKTNYPPRTVKLCEFDPKTKQSQIIPGDQSKTVEFLMDSICTFMTSGTGEVQYTAQMKHRVPSEWKNYRLEVAFNRKLRRLTLTEFSQAFFNRFSAVLYRLSRIWRVLFPATYISSSPSNMGALLNQWSLESPELFKMIYSIGRTSRDTSFLEEARAMLAKKEAAELEGKSFNVPRPSLMGYNMILFMIKDLRSVMTVDQNEATRKKAKNSQNSRCLEAVLTKICTDPSLTLNGPSLNVNKDNCLERCTHLLNQAFSFNNNVLGALPSIKRVYDTIDYLYMNYAVDKQEIEDRFLQVLDNVDSKHKIRIEQFKKAAIRLSAASQRNRYTVTGLGVSMCEVLAEDIPTIQLKVGKLLNERISYSHSLRASAENARLEQVANHMIDSAPEAVDYDIVPVGVSARRKATKRNKTAVEADADSDAN